MPKFKSKPAASVDPDSEAVVEFVGGAGFQSTELPRMPRSIALQPSPRAALRDVAGHAKTEKPTCGVNLRLTEHELELLRHLAALEDRSIQKTIKRILIPAVELALRSTKEAHDTSK